MSNITLSTGIRNNLLSLQQTASDLTTTQQQLSTGKKVNTAFDNPQSYFTSQSLTNRANDLSSLLDQIGQAQQTLNAANDGLTGLTSLLEQALSSAQQAQQATTGTVNYPNVTGTTNIAADTAQAVSTSTVANAVAGVTASVQSNIALGASSFGASGLTNGDTLTFKLGSDTTVSVTYSTGGGTNSFSSAANLITLLNSSGNLSGEATAATDGAGGITVTANDLTNDFATLGGTGAAESAVAGSTTAAAHSLGSALTVSDGTTNKTVYYVANNGANTTDAFTTAAQLVGANALGSSVGTVNVSQAGGILTLGSSSKSITVSGAIGAALGFGTSAYSDNYNQTLSSLISGAGNHTVTIGVGTDTTHTLTFGTGSGDISTKAELTTALSGFTDITGSINSSNKLNFNPSSTSAVTIGGDANALTALGLSAETIDPTATVVTASSTRATLQDNFNSTLTQLDQLASDSSYNGVNLLNGNNLKVNFNENGTSGLTIAGVNDSSTGLGLSQLSASEFQDNNTISGIVAQINTAITAVRAQTETFGTNSSTISTRQTFETNIINTLQTGASNLVLADQNQASANLLTEQTRQQLEISSLSIANQANQAVLKLFP